MATASGRAATLPILNRIAHEARAIARFRQGATDLDRAVYHVVAADPPTVLRREPIGNRPYFGRPRWRVRWHHGDAPR